MGDIFVRLKSLPRGMRGLTILDSDGNYNVYINSRLSDDGRAEAYWHEIEHIENDDFYNDVDIRRAERI